MWYIVISLIGLGVVAAIAGYFRNKKLQKMLERGEISEIPEAQEIPEVCCGQHETCERDSLLAAVSKKIEYYNDEELDRFQGVEADAYDEEAVEEFSEVLYTLREVEVAGWLRSLQLRGINLPDALKDEAFLIIGERLVTIPFPVAVERKVEETGIVHDANPALVTVTPASEETINVETKVQAGSLLIIRNEGTGVATVGGANCAASKVTTLIWDGNAYVEIATSDIS